MEGRGDFGRGEGTIIGFIASASYIGSTSAAACAQLGPQVFDQLAHRIGDSLDALEFEDYFMYPLDFVGRYDPAGEDATPVGRRSPHAIDDMFI